MKKCSKCSTLKPLSDFHLNRNSGSKATHQSRCKKCQSENTTQWRKKWLADKGLTTGDISRLRKYKITKEQFIALNIEQNHCCKICGNKVTGKVLDVDHCHKTGRIRGLLCNPCNRLLSNCRDNLDILASAASYLQNSII